MDKITELFELNKQISEELMGLAKKLPDEDKEDDFETSGELKKLTGLKDNPRKYSDLFTKRNQIMRKIIGQMYKGSLITDEVNIRQGGIYRKRKRYSLDLPPFCRIVKKHLSEVKEKLTPENLTLLEMIMDIVENEYSDWGDRPSDDGETKDDIEFKLPQTEVVSETTINSEGGVENITIRRINKINLGEDGITFWEDGDYSSLSLPSYVTKGLFLKYEKDLINLGRDFIKSAEKKVVKLEKDIQILADKGGNLLAMASIIDEERKED